MASPTLPADWSYTDDTATTATAPDGSTATGQVLGYVTQSVTDLATAQANITTLQGQVADLQAQLDALTGGGDDHAAIVALQAAVASLHNDVDDLSSQIVALQASDTSNTAAITALQAAVATLQGIDTAAAAAFTAPTA